jgi:hypothetical protein
VAQGLLSPTERTGVHCVQGGALAGGAVRVAGSRPSPTSSCPCWRPISSLRSVRLSPSCSNPGVSRTMTARRMDRCVDSPAVQGTTQSRRGRGALRAGLGTRDSCAVLTAPLSCIAASALSSQLPVRRRCNCSSMRSSLSAIRRATSVSLCVIVCINCNILRWASDHIAFDQELRGGLMSIKAEVHGVCDI